MRLCSGGCIALKMFEHSDQFPSSPRTPGFSPEACPGISGRGPGPKATDLCGVFPWTGPWFHMGTGLGENGECQRRVHVSSEELISPTCLFGRLLRNLSLRARHCPPCKERRRTLQGGGPHPFYRGGPEIGSGLLSECSGWYWNSCGLSAASGLPCALGNRHHPGLPWHK